MNMRQSGSIISFVIVGGLLFMLLLGAVYFAKNNLGAVGNRAEQAAQTARQKAEEAAKKAEADKKQAEQKSEQQAAADRRAEEQKAAEKKAAEQRAAAQQTASTTANTVPTTATGQLPATGPGETITLLIALAGLAVAAVKYRQSKQALLG